MDKSDNRISLAVLLVLLTLTACSHAVENRVHFLGPGGNYQWSPSGNYLSFIRDSDFCLYLSAGDSITVVGKAPYGQYAWIDDSNLVFNFSAKPGRDSIGLATLKYMKLRFEQADKLQLDSVVKVDYREAHAARLFSDGMGAVRLQVSAEGPHCVVADPTAVARRLSHSYRGAECEIRDDVWLTDTYGRKIRKLTSGLQLKFPKFCPSRVLVAASDVRGHILIFDSAGTVIADAGYGGGSGRFSRDCNTVFFNTEVDSETDIVGGDIYAFSLPDSATTQLTHSPNRPELQLLPSPDGQMLVYTVYGKGGGIEIMFLSGGTR